MSARPRRWCGADPADPQGFSEHHLISPHAPCSRSSHTPLAPVSAWLIPTLTSNLSSNITSSRKPSLTQTKLSQHHLSVGLFNEGPSLPYQIVSFMSVGNTSILFSVVSPAPGSGFITKQLFNSCLFNGWMCTSG